MSESKIIFSCSHYQTRQHVPANQPNFPIYLSLWYLIWLLFRSGDPNIRLCTCLSPAQLQTHFHDISLSRSSKVQLARSHRSSIVWDSQCVTRCSCNASLSRGRKYKRTSMGCNCVVFRFTVMCVCDMWVCLCVYKWTLPDYSRYIHSQVLYLSTI